MYIVEFDELKCRCSSEFNSLDEAMQFARSNGHMQVTITNGETTIIGKFGVDSVADGKLPCGTEYTWRKRR